MKAETENVCDARYSSAFDHMLKRSERMDPQENVYAYEQQPSVC
jgi:hypothetical protein